jgi:predicted amidohydrolase
MAGLRIAAAQSASIPGDIAANVRRHCLFIDAAAAAKVQLLVFPELSLSGYEPSLLADAALSPDDARLAPLQQRADATGMTIVVGVPLSNNSGLPYIGAIAFQPHGPARSYRKHFLYPGEEQFAAAGAAISMLIDLQGVSVGLAICNDTSDQRHPHAAMVAGATLYVTGAVLTPDGHKAESARLAGYARLFNIGILLANHAYATGGYPSAGGSAAWLPDGQLLVNAAGQGELLVIADEDSGDVIPVDTSGDVYSPLGTD